MKPAPKRKAPRKPKDRVIGDIRLYMLEELGVIAVGRWHFYLKEAKEAHAWLSKSIAWMEAKKEGKR